jgi:flagellar motor switch protein FliN/FliY
MREDMELPAFERPTPKSHAADAVADAAGLGRLSDVPVELAVEIGRTRMTVGATLELRPGSIVVLDRVAGEPVDLLVNGTPIARGEVVVIDEEFALRVTEVIGERAGSAAQAGADAAGGEVPTHSDPAAAA